jgi:hypothetical protein
MRYFAVDLETQIFCFSVRDTFHTQNIKPEFRSSHIPHNSDQNYSYNVLLNNVKIIIFHLWIQLSTSDCALLHILVLKHISDSHVWRNICYSLSHPTAEPSFSSQITKLLDSFTPNSVPKTSGVQRLQGRCLGTAWRKHVQQESLFPEKYQFLFN